MTRKAELSARRAFSEFITSDFSASTVASSLIETSQNTDQDGNTTGSADELESTLNLMKNDTSAVMSGVVKLDECVDAEGKYLLVRMGWKPEFSRAAAGVAGVMAESAKSSGREDAKRSKVDWPVDIAEESRLRMISDFSAFGWFLLYLGCLGCPRYLSRYARSCRGWERVTMVRSSSPVRALSLNLSIEYYAEGERNSFVSFRDGRYGFMCSAKGNNRDCLSMPRGALDFKTLEVKEGLEGVIEDINAATKRYQGISADFSYPRSARGAKIKVVI